MKRHYNHTHCMHDIVCLSMCGFVALEAHRLPIFSDAVIYKQLRLAGMLQHLLYGVQDTS